MLKFYYRPDRDNYRVWRSDWQGDMFEIYTADDFEILRYHLARFSIYMEAGED